MKRETLRSFRHRAAVFVGATLVCAVFHRAFVTELFARWEYFGFVYSNKGATAAIAAYVLATLPSLVIPTRSSRPTISIPWALYLLVFIPSIFCVALISPRLEYAMPLLLSLTAGMCIIAAPYYVRVPDAVGSSLRRLRPTYPSFMAAVWVVAGLLLLATVVSYWDSLSFAALDTMYEVRLSSRSIQQDSPIGRYFTHWLCRALLPFLLVVALWRRRYYALIPITGAYALLFMETAHKVYFILPITVAGVFFLARFFPKHLGLALMYSVLAMFALSLAFGSPVVRDLIFMRGTGWSGLTSYVYDDFVRSHPTTWWSHIKGVSLFVSYPYGEAIPFVIGWEYWKNPDLTSNAHFWAMDGIMAAGNLGVIAISLVCAALLGAIDTLGKSIAPAIAIPWMSAYATSLGDAGLFQALLTGGLGFVLLLMMPLLPDSLRSGAERSHCGPRDTLRSVPTLARVTQLGDR